MKVKGIGIALLAGGLLLTGCSASSNKSDSNTLIIGTEGTFAPFSYHNDVGRILRTFKIKKNVEVTDNGKIII